VSLSSDDPVRVVHEQLVCDSPMVAASGAGRRVGAALASDLEDRVIELRHLDDLVSSRELLPAILKEFG
jgi:hypothetical protein